MTENCRVILFFFRKLRSRFPFYHVHTLYCKIIFREGRIDLAVLLRLCFKFLEQFKLSFNIILTAIIHLFLMKFQIWLLLTLLIVTTVYTIFLFDLFQLPQATDFRVLIEFNIRRLLGCLILGIYLIVYASFLSLTTASLTLLNIISDQCNPKYCHMYDQIKNQ